jgi:hypothetical protein
MSNAHEKRCIECNALLPEGREKFCSTKCATRARVRRHRLKHSDERTAHVKIRRTQLRRLVEQEQTGARKAHGDQLQLISGRKDGLVRKIYVLMARGYVPIGIVGLSYRTCDVLAGYFPDKEAHRLMEVFTSARYDDSNDLGTVTRAKRDLEIV